MPDFSSAEIVTSLPLQATEDGSLSLFHPQLEELYHNRAGAYLEAGINYATPALKLLQCRRRQGSLKLLDACFGLGYNSLVFYQKAKELSLKLEITGVDNAPEVLALLPDILAQKFFQDLKIDLETGLCALELREEDLRIFLKQQQLGKKTEEYDLIFHDAFSPRKIPELWSYELFSHYFQLLKPGGAVLTYASASAVRGALLDCGYLLLRTQALGGKPPGLMAIKEDPQDDSSLKAKLLEVFSLDRGRDLKARGRLPYRDENLNLSRAEILQLRRQAQAEIRN